jgi:hypothetical protein
MTKSIPAAIAPAKMTTARVRFKERFWSSKAASLFSTFSKSAGDCGAMAFSPSVVSNAG